MTEVKRAVIPALHRLPGGRRLRRRRELSFWRSVVGVEGIDRYEEVYTDGFGVDRDFYAGKRVLDVGCGPRGPLEWADMAAERVGLDPLADDYREFGIDAHETCYVAAPAERMPFPDGYFDVVISLNSLDHVDNLDKTVSEVTRVTKPGGTLLVATDVNHRATMMEPQRFSWDVLDRFGGWRVESSRRLEKHSDTQQTILNPVRFDESDRTSRYGMLVARLAKL